MQAKAEIVTLTLNPAIDQSLTIPYFHAGTVNRVELEQSDPGGKGVNVSSFLADLGFSSSATGFLGKDNAAVFEHLFAEKSIQDSFVHLAGKTRVNIKIIDAEQHRITDINFPGLIANEASIHALHLKLESLIPSHAWFVLSGSLPEGVPADFYEKLILRLKRAGKQVLLDSSGAALVAGIQAKPHIIKPNIVELEELLGKRLETEAQVVEAARNLVSSGIKNVVVSMGKLGAIFVDAEQCILAQPPLVNVKSTVGAGDAMVAGLIAAKMQKLDLVASAKLATVSAIGALSALGPKLPDAAVLQSYLEEVTIKVY